MVLFLQLWVVILSEGCWVATLVRQGLDLLALELHVSALQTVACHHAGHVVVPFGTEECRANGPDGIARQGVSDVEGLAREHLGQRLLLERDLVFMFEHDNGHAVVRTAFLCVGRQPREDDRSFRELGEVDERRGRCDGDIRGEEMTARIEAVGFEVGNVRVHHGDGEEALAACKALNRETQRNLADGRINKVAGRDLLAAEEHSNVNFEIAGWHDIWHDLHSFNTLDLDFVAVFAPLALGQESVYGLVEVACNS